ncbi:MAG TPA: hypothetical protein VMG34_04240 [Bacteroidota bacterium]|nr:hypothetical protein [Bacteroidota bacterium]
MKPVERLVLLLAFAALGTSAFAQEGTASKKHLMKEDSAAINALVMYPDTIRLDIFEACKYPSAIASIASLQKNSSEEFSQLVTSYTKEEQENFWNLSRYPGLISRLAEEGDKSADKITTILKDYPEDIRQTAMQYGIDYYDLLREMDSIQNKTDSMFDQILGDYPETTQQSLKELLQYPEVINLLNDHLGLTVRVGDSYRRDPQALIRKADSLNLAQTRQNTVDAEAWKETVESDPDAEAELNKAADDYASENGYTQQEVDAAPDPQYVTTYVCYPYPYWFGYPTWYPYDYWYPYPFWFDCGFYHDRRGHIVIFGSPSRYFTNWYFYYPEHVRRYPHLCDTYIDHYYGRGRSPGGSSRIVHNWVHQRKDYLPPDFTKNRTRRVETIRQLASLDIDASTNGTPVDSRTRSDYYSKNAGKFSALVAPRHATVDAGTRTADEEIPRPVKQPPGRVDMMPVLGSSPSRFVVKPPEKVDQVRMTPPTPPPSTARPGTKSGVDQAPPPSTVNPPITTVRPRPAQQVDRQVQARPAPQPTYNFDTIHRAQEYQRNMWEQTQPAARPQPQVQQPRPQPQQPRIQSPPPPRPAPAPSKSRNN